MKHDLQSRGRPGRSKGGEGERGGSMVDGWEDTRPETGAEEEGGRKKWENGRGTVQDVRGLSLIHI